MPWEMHSALDVRKCPSTNTFLRMDESRLIHDWNQEEQDFDWHSCKVELDDETLRDGLQCPSVRNPEIDDKIKLVHLMVSLGIHAVDIGLPGAGERAAHDALLL